MNIPGYDAWKLMSPEDERERYIGGYPDEEEEARYDAELDERLEAHARDPEPCEDYPERPVTPWTVGKTYREADAEGHAPDDEPTEFDMAIRAAVEGVHYLFEISETPQERDRAHWLCTNAIIRAERDAKARERS